MSVCTHDRPRVAETHDYCPDCGAVRMKPIGRDGARRPEAWHTCHLCRLPGS